MAIQYFKLVHYQKEQPPNWVTAVDFSRNLTLDEKSEYSKKEDTQKSWTFRDSETRVTGEKPERKNWHRPIQLWREGFLFEKVQQFP